MRRLGCALIAMICVTASPATAAQVKTDVKVETYRISGDSGEVLMKAMDRNGPRHGFLTRAIAQTRYSVEWELGWAKSGKQCRLKTADVVLSVKYRYPNLASSAPMALQRKWAKFMVGVRKHEETHGRIARQMAAAAQKSVLRVSIADDPSCRKAKREVTRIVRATYDDYEARQHRFDALEHQPGGTVDRLVGALVKRR